MLPIRTFRTTILTALCILVASGGVFWVLSHTNISSSTPTALLPTPQIAADITPTLTSQTNTSTSTDIATSTKNVTVAKNSKQTTKTVSINRSLPTHLTDAEYITTLTRLIYSATNDFRRNHQLGTFTTDTALTRHSITYSNTMLAGDFLSHTDQSGCDMSCRFDRDGYEAWAWGENLAVLDFDERPTPEYVANYFMTAWEKSADHRANLLNPAYTVTGIGVALDTNHIYVTVQFAKPK